MFDDDNEDEDGVDDAGWSAEDKAIVERYVEQRGRGKLGSGVITFILCEAWYSKLLTNFLLRKG
ncbi:hypothetical protein LTR28_001344 [Elasticomyces elasticus]|nr:hypothetical protein LTR28_001344 [Elasticomyces elasticus]